MLERFPVWRIPGAELVEKGRGDLSYFLRVRPCGAGTRYSVYRDSRKIGHADSRTEALECLLSHLQVAVAEAAQGEVFVHAGVVGWKGRAIILPGRSFCGKTSLVVEFLRCGATYYSDEYAVFDRAGAVHPYARPLQIRSRHGGRVQVRRADELGAAVGSGPLGVVLIVFPKYVQRAVWQARQLTPGKALLGLLENTVCARKRPQESIEALRPVAVGARAFRVRHGGARNAVGAILELL